MNRTTFLLEDKIQEIKKSFIKDGWLKIYESNRDNEDDKNQVLIFCCLVEPKRLKEYKQSTNWEISPGCEGKPSIFSSHKNGKPISWYQTYSEKGIEPFIFSKDFNFSDGYDSYFDISEEFVLYFKLYEKGKSKQERSFYFIDEVGDLEEVISIKPNIIRVKLKYLKEYIAIRKIHFAICFDFCAYPIRVVS